MKSLLLCIALIGLFSLSSAQNSLPYQKGENMISLRNPYISAIREPNGPNLGFRYGFELDYHHFIRKHWSLGIGSSYHQSVYPAGRDLNALGLHLSSRYYSPSIFIKNTSLNFFGELWAGFQGTSAKIRLRYPSRPYVYAGLGAAWRPFPALSVDFVVYRRSNKPSHYIDWVGPTSAWGDAWNASLGLNFHWPQRVD